MTDFKTKMKYILSGFYRNSPFLVLLLPSVYLAANVMFATPALPENSLLLDISFILIITLICLLLICGPVGLIIILISFLRWKRINGRRTFFIGVLFIISFTSTAWAVMCGIYFRDLYLIKATVVGQTLINAVGKYHDEQGHYPEELTDLIPRYISGVPSTGLRRYPEFNYASIYTQCKTNEDECEYYRSRGGYVISIDTPLFLGEDHLEYWPDRECSKGMKKIAGWVYIAD